MQTMRGLMGFTLMQPSYFLCQRMLHFIQTYQHYMTFEVRVLGLHACCVGPASLFHQGAGTMQSAPAKVQPNRVPGVSFESRQLIARALFPVMVCPAPVVEYISCLDQICRTVLEE
jgi:hypothetical protein